ncbi:MAG: hypothetical protein J6Y16_10830 [Treponema sp.]|nr:hypothetical protein [Treponema sp.]
MKKNLIGIVLLFLVTSVFADEKLFQHHESYTVSSDNGSYYLYLDYDNNKTSCYRKSEEETSPVWEMDGFYEYVYIDDTGTYCVINNWPDLIPQEYKKNWNLFRIYKNGKEYAKIKFSDVIKDTKKLVKTESHYRWGNLYAVYEKGIILDTVEGVKIYNFQKKSFLSLTDKRITTPWTEEELIDSSLELISSDQKIEKYLGFSEFESDSLSGKSVAAYLGTITEKEYKTDEGEYWVQKEISVVPPELFWRIDSNGVLEMASDPSFKNDVIRISKIYYNPRKKKVYAIEDNKFEVFKYEK